MCVRLPCGIPAILMPLEGKYEKQLTLPANRRGALETQRYSFDLTETVISWRMGLYLATVIALDFMIKVGQIGIRKV